MGSLCAARPSLCALNGGSCCSATLPCSLFALSPVRAAGREGTRGSGSRARCGTGSERRAGTGRALPPAQAPPLQLCGSSRQSPSVFPPGFEEGLFPVCGFVVFFPTLRFSERSPWGSSRPVSQRCCLPASPAGVEELLLLSFASPEPSALRRRLRIAETPRELRGPALLGALGSPALGARDFSSVSGFRYFGGRFQTSSVEGWRTNLLFAPWCQGRLCPKLPPCPKHIMVFGFPLTSLAC